jgi:hypothetical protein
VKVGTISAALDLLAPAQRSLGEATPNGERSSGGAGGASRSSRGKK